MILPPPVPPFLTYFPIVGSHPTQHCQPPLSVGNLAQDADYYSDPSCNNCHIPLLPPSAAQLVLLSLLLSDELPTNIKFIRDN